MTVNIELSNNDTVVISTLNTPQKITDQGFLKSVNLLEVDLSDMASGDTLIFTYRRAASVTPAQPDMLLGIFEDAQAQPLAAFAPQIVSSNEDEGEYWVEQTTGVAVTFDWYYRAIYLTG